MEAFLSFNEKHFKLGQYPFPDFDRQVFVHDVSTKQSLIIFDFLVDRVKITKGIYNSVLRVLL